MIEINIDPVAFTIGPIVVRWYGILVAVAVAVVILWGWRQIRKKADLSKLPDPAILVIAIASGVGVSKAFHVIDRWEHYSQNLGEIFSGAGLTIYGAVIGASLAFWIFTRVKHSQFGFFADLVAPGIILGQAIGRVGCLINGCCYGNYCEVAAPSWLPWGIIYTHPNSYAPLGEPVIPAQIYEIVFALALFGVLFKLMGRLKPDGSLFLLYLASYSAWRVGIDFLRVGTPFVFGLHQAQFIAIVVLAITIPILALRTRWVKTEAKS